MRGYERTPRRQDSNHGESANLRRTENGGGRLLLPFTQCRGILVSPKDVLIVFAWVRIFFSTAISILLDRFACDVVAIVRFLWQANEEDE